MAIVMLGIDVAKHVFALHGVDEAGRTALVPPLVRSDHMLKAVPVKPEPARQLTPTPPCPA